MKVAVVHDWLTMYAGSERVLEQILALYPEANLYSLVDFLPQRDRHIIMNKAVKTSFIHNLPFAKKHFRSYLPLFPMAVERFDLAGYELVISSSHAVAKGVITRPDQMHICYCHTPMRYAWDLSHQYLKEARLEKGPKGFLVKAVLRYLRRWDLATANRVDHFAANSQYVAERIKRIYGREAAVIYPPVDAENFTFYSNKEDFYVTASRMVPYKKVGLIVEAFSSMPDKKLVVIGDGPGFARVKTMAGKNIELLGYQSPSVLQKYLQRARAFVFAAEEDFGIVPVEAQACGTPVIAYGRGGSLETVIDGKTGIFFHQQTVDAVKSAVERFEEIRHTFDARQIRIHAEQFGIDRFRKEFREFVDSAPTNHRSRS